MQCIYNYISETNRVSRVCSVPAVLYLQFVLLVTLFCILNTYWTFTLVLSEVHNKAFSCSLLVLCFPSLLLRYCLYDFVMSLLLLLSLLAFTFHVHRISIVRSLYFRIFSAFFLIIFLPPEIVYYYYYHHHHNRILYAGYLYSWDKLWPQGIQCCSYSVVTIHGAYIVSFIVESIVLLHYYFPKYVCSAKYGCFL